MINLTKIYFICLFLFSCATNVADAAESQYLYMGIGPSDETLVLSEKKMSGQYSVIIGDILINETIIINENSDFLFSLDDLNLNLFIPKEIDLNDYLVDQKWPYNGCNHEVIKSQPRFAPTDTSWQHTIKSECNNQDNSVLFVFSSRFGLVAFFKTESQSNLPFVSGYILSGSTFGVGSSKP